MRRVDVTGMRFGRLVALRRAGTAGKNAVWLCECSCGGIARVPLDRLRNGYTKSCGCLRVESARRNCSTPRARRVASERMKALNAARRAAAESAPTSAQMAFDALERAWPGL